MLAALLLLYFYLLKRITTAAKFDFDKADIDLVDHIILFNY